jgi:hypothetical protein
LLDLERARRRCHRDLQGEHHVVGDVETQRAPDLGPDQIRRERDATTLPASSRFGNSSPTALSLTAVVAS